MLHPFLWYRDKEVVKIGGVVRYSIQYRRIDANVKEIFLRLKNIEKTSIRAIHLLNGPFILYCHVVPYRYDSHDKFLPEDVSHNKEVIFDNQVKPGQTFNVRLNLNHNSFVRREDDNDADLFQWDVDIVSQIFNSQRASILFDFMIGDDLKLMKHLNRGPLQSRFNSLGTTFSSGSDDTLNGSVRSIPPKLGQPSNPQLTVVKQTAKDIWSAPPKWPGEPIHLVIVTHGIFSNLTADMLYLKDSLEKVATDNILVRGYSGNAGRTDKGVKKLGIGVADYVVLLIKELQEKGNVINRISFVAHSLGGPVQLYAIKHILLQEGTTYFENNGIQPYNLVCLASPLLGILSEMSFIISWFLDLGTLGKTGRDLTLLKKIPNIKELSVHHDEGEEAKRRNALKPLLEVLPDDPLQKCLASFKHLTLYANAINDGIVPLRTSALLYLDWQALGDVTEIMKNTDADISRRPLLETNRSRDTVGEIPGDISEEDDKNTESFKSKFKRKTRLSRKERNFLAISAKGSDYFDLLRQDGDDDKDEDVNGEGEREEVKKKETGEHSNATDHTSTESSNNEPRKSDSQSTQLNIPPQASAVESAINTLICPIPSTEYLFEPDLRRHVIFHDKFYQFKDLPEAESRKSSAFKWFFHYNDWKLHKQVKIAKKYHTADMNWRKVLVNLPPDAHNNIVVRRRFSNGYGWGVVHHLCEELFIEKEREKL